MIDIKKERREFAAYKRLQEPQANGCDDVYVSSIFPWEFTGWLAAKRSIETKIPVECCPLHGLNHVCAAKRASVGSVGAEAIRQRKLRGSEDWRDIEADEYDATSKELMGYEYRIVYTAQPSTDAKDALIDNLPKPIYQNKHAGGTVGYLATEHYNEGWNDCLEAVKAIAAKEQTCKK